VLLLLLLVRLSSCCCHSCLLLLLLHVLLRGEHLAINCHRNAIRQRHLACSTARNSTTVSMEADRVCSPADCSPLRYRT